MDTLLHLKAALDDRYRVEELIGEGGMALVYRAQDRKHRRPVAIKVLRPEVSPTSGTERFLREIEVAAGLNHPNILALYDSGEADGLLYFVMPLVEGESLRQRLDQEAPLPLSEALRIAGEVGDALDYAHRHGLVHRDVKPENVLFQAGHALVGDFGIAQVTTHAGDRLTRTGLAMGTFTYMSPEQLGGEGEVDGRADVYALGCLLHEMLAGAPPFEASTPQASMAKKLTGPAPNLQGLRADVPATVQKVLAGALAVRPDDRYPTAGAFVQALETANTAAAVEADLRRRKRRKNLRMGAGALGVGLLAVGTWWIASLSGGPAMQRIAVLPFVDERTDPAQEYLVQGIYQDLVLEMARAGLRVINPNSMARYAGTDRPSREIAEELGVDGIVQGRPTFQAGGVALDLTLVDGETDEIVWTDRFLPQNTATLYRAVTRSIAQSIGFPLSREAVARLSETQEVDPQVYDALLQARFHWQKLTEDGFDQAERYYRLALARDSLSAEAWYGLSRMWHLRAQMGLISTAEANRHSQPATARAEELDPGLSGLQEELAFRSVWVNWDWEGGRQAFIRALEADPTNSLTRVYYALSLLYLNRDKEALDQGREAANLDPFNTLVQGIYAQVLNFLHRPEEAESVLLGVQERDPEAPIVTSTLRTTYHLLGRYEEAMEMWRTSYRAAGDTEALAALDRGYDSGGYEAALKAVAELFVARAQTYATRADTEFVTPWQIATLYTRAGEKELALEYLERAFDARDQNMPSIAVDPIFDSIRSDPRFQSLMARTGLTE